MYPYSRFRARASADYVAMAALWTYAEDTQGVEDAQQNKQFLLCIYVLHTLLFELDQIKCFNVPNPNALLPSTYSTTAVALQGTLLILTKVLITVTPSASRCATRISRVIVVRDLWRGFIWQISRRVWCNRKYYKVHYCV